MRILLAIDEQAHLQEVMKSLLNFLNVYSMDKVVLDVFHSYEKPVVKGKSMPNTELEIIENERNYQNEFMKRAEVTVKAQVDVFTKKNIEVNTILKEGVFMREMLNQLNDESYNLLVLEPTKRSSFDKFFRKDKVKSLLDKVEVPMLIIPKGDEVFAENFNLIGLVKNYENMLYIRELPVYKWAHQERRTLLHIGDELDNNVELKVIPAIEQSTDHIFQDYVLKNENNNLYIIDHQKRHGLKDFFKRSFTQNLLSTGYMNIIVV